MDIVKFQNKLNIAWKEVLDKKETDDNYEKGAQVKAHEDYWLTLNKNNLPGIIIKGNNKKINLNKFPKAKGWSFYFTNSEIKMNVNEEKYKELIVF
jgi:hypothetical protein